MTPPRRPWTGPWRIVDGGKMGAFMAARPTFCDDCGIAEICLGGCKAAAEVCCGDVSALELFLGAFVGEVVKR